ncbi:HAD family hydrolase [Desulfopila sp. IMCC35006]|uniref:HAD family hydrolase n=1 Tax=Desulfopila sp. IMCC35006 TaxID=2569542 RepID=UPI0010AD6B31|nr:HAD family hydrolase [Desulfopila sp. IMCC35006]TKB27353.1 HAD family hydrolase [Desulfopila sp. IMCC35006]
MSFLSIIFDLDGTLLDTIVDLAETCNEVLALQHFPTHPTPAYKTFVGDGLQSLIRRITPVGTDDIILRQCSTLFAERYARNWKRNSCPYDGISDMLSALNKHGVQLAILSNKPHEFTKLFVDEFFPHGLFSIVYGQREGVPKKPDPTVALEIAERFGSLPQETIFVGDSGVDMRTGKAAGMIAAGVSWGFRSVQELTDSNADIIIHNPSELEQYVLFPT